MKKQRKIPAAVKIIAITLAVLVVCAAGAWLYVFAGCQSAARVLSAPAAYTPVKFRVFGSGASSISAHFSLYDALGTEIAAVERSWNDNSLAFDFIAVRFGEDVIMFPYKIRGGNAESAASGVDLIRYYEQDGSCLMYGALGTEEQRALDTLFWYAAHIVPRFPSKHGAVVSLELRNCRTGLEYHIISRSNGSVMLGTE